MVCEGLLRYFGSSSEELLEQGAERAKKFYQAQIEELIAKVNKLTSENSQLTSELEEIKKTFTSKQWCLLKLFPKIFTDFRGFFSFKYYFSFKIHSINLHTANNLLSSFTIYIPEKILIPSPTYAYFLEKF